MRDSPDHLILLDDPAFLPDMALPALDLDISHLSLERAGFHESQGSLLDPYSQSSRRGSNSSRSGSVLGIVIPTSDTGGVSYQLPYNEPFPLGGSSFHKLSSIGRPPPDEEEALIDEFDFEFDADGEIREVYVGELAPFRTGGIISQVGRLDSDSAASERVRREHEEGIAKLIQQPTNDGDGDFIMQFDNENAVLPEAEPFPTMAAGGKPQKPQSESESSIVPTEASTISAEAIQKQRKRKASKKIMVDNQLELTNTDLRNWQNNYLANMAAATHDKEVHRARAQAKKNANAWVFGNGLGDLGRDARYIKYNGALSMFTGDKLMALITGVPSKVPTTPSPKRGRREDDFESATRRVRARTEDGEQIGRGLADDEALLPIFDESMPHEVGREAQLALEDYASSVMPWNISASLHSFRAFPVPGSSSAQGRGTIDRASSIYVSGARPGSRLASASPLLGRSRADLPDLERVHEYELPNLGEPDNLNALEIQRGRILSGIDTQDLEFEMFGPAAAVDTQTAQSSAWVKEALAKESMNFLEYVKNTINEENIMAQEDEINENREREEVKEVSFEMLFPPESNRMMVAAQAFHHVLTLATKNLLSVKQEGVELFQPFGDIWMGIREVI